MLGTTELLVIAGIVVLLFGASKLPKLGGAIGESIKNFKKGVSDDAPKIADKSDDKGKESNGG